MTDNELAILRRIADALERIANALEPGTPRNLTVRDAIALICDRLEQ
jgi:hypothetical protein